MTDDELLNGYSGYSDRELADFIASGIPEEQANDFRRLLMLRRRSHYSSHLHTPPEQAKQVSQPPEFPTTPTPKEPNNPEKQPKPKKKKGGCIKNIFIIIVIIILLFFGLVILESLSSPY